MDAAVALSLVLVVVAVLVIGSPARAGAACEPRPRSASRRSSTTVTWTSRSRSRRARRSPSRTQQGRQVDAARGGGRPAAARPRARAARRARAHGPWRFVPPHDRQVALLAQDPLLFPHLSVLDNVAFGPRSRGGGRQDARAAALRWLDEVDAATLADRRPGAALRQPGPTGGAGPGPRRRAGPAPARRADGRAGRGGAPSLRQTVRRVLAERTVVLVTHDVLDALLLADRVAVLDGGRIAESVRPPRCWNGRAAFAAGSPGSTWSRAGGRTAPWPAPTGSR